MTAARGRPHASSREMLADAACELFLEQGYEGTSVSEITRRAGVSRSSFFNYFSSKPDTVWFAFDEHLERVLDELRKPETPLPAALAEFGSGPSPETLALAIVDARTMGIESELARGRADRQLRLGQAIASRILRDTGSPAVEGTDTGALAAARAEIAGAAYAAALVGAVWRWAAMGAGRHRLADVVAETLPLAERTISLS